MKETLKYTIGILITLTVGWVVGYLSPRTGKANDGHSDTTTVITYDTVRVYQPQAVKTYVIGSYKLASVPTLLSITDTVKTPYYVHDTLVIPIEQRYYSSPQYQAWVSGFSARLDSILVYSPIETHVITNTVRKTANNELFIDARLSYIYPDLLVGVNLRGEYIRNDQWGFFLETGLTSGVQTRLYGMFGISYRLYSKKW